MALGIRAEATSPGGDPAPPEPDVGGVPYPNAGPWHGKAWWSDSYSFDTSSRSLNFFRLLVPQLDGHWHYNDGSEHELPYFGNEATDYFNSSLPDYNIRLRNKYRVFGPVFGVLASYSSWNASDPIPVTDAEWIARVPDSYQYYDVLPGQSFQFFNEKVGVIIDGINSQVWWARSLFWPGKHLSDFPWHGALSGAGGDKTVDAGSDAIAGAGGDALNPANL